MMVFLTVSVVILLYPLLASAGRPADDPDQNAVTETPTTEAIPPVGEVGVGSLPPVPTSAATGAPQVMPFLAPAAPNKENAPAEVPEATPIPEHGLASGTCAD